MELCVHKPTKETSQHEDLISWELSYSLKLELITKLRNCCVDGWRNLSGLTLEFGFFMKTEVEI